jgi:ribose transport system permease protein
LTGATTYGNIRVAPEGRSPRAASKSMTTATVSKRFPASLRDLFLRDNVGIAIFAVGLLILCSLTSDVFLRPRNITTILRQISVLGICAFGGTLVLLVGNIDLSIGSCAVFTGIVTAALIQRLGFSIPLACVLGVLSGGAVGLLNGAILTQIGIPSIVTTIGTMTLFRGLSYVVCGSGDAASSGIINLPKAFAWIGSGQVGFLPISVLFTIAVFLVLFLIVDKMPIGRHVYSVGSNEEAALISGINVDLIKVLMFVVSGLCAGIGGVLSASRMNSGQPTALSGLEIDALTAAVLGGVSTAGGKGKLTGVIFGVLTIGMLQNWLVLMNVEYFYQLVIKGGVLIAAVLIDLLRVNRAVEHKEVAAVAITGQGLPRNEGTSQQEGKER